MDTDNRKLRSIPAIDRLLAANTMKSELNQYPRQLVMACLRQAVANARQALMGGTAVEVSPEALVADARRLLAKQISPSLRRVINATGVVLHTNLGRAPLGSRARARVAEVMDGYSTLEY
ncbi:MAG: L-seryl-tRNA(Sec) selenium transferase, partial [Sporomusa sp.]